MSHRSAIIKTEELFYSHLPESVLPSGDPVEQRLLAEYGAVFVAAGGAIPPSKIVFRNEDEVLAFQESFAPGVAMIGGFQIELQSEAMNNLLAAIEKANDSGLSITPRGPDSARRNYTGTVELWLSRVEPGLRHWTEQGRIGQPAADHILSLSPFDQVREILKLELDGIYFAKDLSKSIIYSVAPPGTSQHLSMLALDITEFNEPRVREIMACYGWYQTVISDLPHFTFLGMTESELVGKGLRKVEFSGRYFWVPDIAGE